MVAALRFQALYVSICIQHQDLALVVSCPEIQLFEMNVFADEYISYLIFTLPSTGAMFLCVVFMRRCQYPDCKASKCKVNWKGFSRKLLWCNRGMILAFAWKDWGKQREPLVGEDSSNFCG